MSQPYQAPAAATTSAQHQGAFTAIAHACRGPWTPHRAHTTLLQVGCGARPASAPACGVLCGRGRGSQPVPRSPPATRHFGLWALDPEPWTLTPPPPPSVCSTQRPPPPLESQLGDRRHTETGPHVTLPSCCHPRTAAACRGTLALTLACACACACARQGTGPPTSTAAAPMATR